ncbi:MAG: bifunctional DNA primase/polymerase [Anaerolineae bacterium]|nr:bifunctional DNA primase/polymerase [Anaerolineae bacterium]
MSENLVAALSYARLGWPILPLHTPTGAGCSCRKAACEGVGKHPRTANGVKDATTGEASIKRWWARWPDANVGLATGKVSGLAVLDVDPRNGGDKTLADLVRKHGPLPPTAKAITGGGGAHYIFTCPAGGLKSGKVGAGLDLKGDGGYIVAAPSLHASGRRYAWDATTLTEGMRLAPIPLWLLTAGDGHGSHIIPQTQPIPPLAERLTAVSTPGYRHDHLVSIAGGLRKADVDLGAALSIAHAWNVANCQPPLSTEEVETTVKDVYGRYAPGPKRRAPIPEPRAAMRFSGADFAKRGGEVAWLWRGWLARGTVTVLAGVQGVGKTTLGLALAAALTRGEKWGDGTLAPTGRVLYIPAEGVDSEVGEKLVRAGAEAVDVLVAEDGTYLTVANDYETILAHAAGYDFIILDSLTAHALADLRKSEQARGFMNRLGELARATGAARVVLHHLRKRTVLDLGEGISQDRVRDSQDILAAARMAWGLEERDDGYLVLAVIKSNLAGQPKPLRLVVDDDGVTFLGEAEEKPEFASGWERAAAWLKDALKGVPRPSGEIRTLATAAGITPKQLRLARERLCVVTERVGRGITAWALPTSLNEGMKGTEGIEGTKGMEGTKPADSVPFVPSMPLIIANEGMTQGHEDEGVGECLECGRPFSPDEAHYILCPDCGASLNGSADGQEPTELPTQDFTGDSS